MKKKKSETNFTPILIRLLPHRYWAEVIPLYSSELVSKWLWHTFVEWLVPGWRKYNHLLKWLVFHIDLHVTTTATAGTVRKLPLLTATANQKIGNIWGLAQTQESFRSKPWNIWRPAQTQESFGLAQNQEQFGLAQNIGIIYKEIRAWIPNISITYLLPVPRDATDTGVGGNRRSLLRLLG